MPSPVNTLNLKAFGPAALFLPPLPDYRENKKKHPPVPPSQIGIKFPI
jgi:hypothetical protein